MTRERSRSFSPAACWVVLAAAITGCVQVPPPPGTPAPLGEQPRDRTTASDETNNARRARVRMELATAYFSRGQLPTALDEVKQVLAIEPNLGEAYNLRGLIYSRMNDHELAEDSFRRAIAINPRDGDALHNYGWHLCQRGRYQEAAEQFGQALAAPQYVGSLRTMLAQGVCEARSGNLLQAEITLKRTYDLDPSNPVVAVNLAEVLLRRGDYERARFYIRRVNQTDDTSNAQTLWLAARIERKLGNEQGVNDFGVKLRNRFPKSREALAFDRGAFDE